MWEWSRDSLENDLRNQRARIPLTQAHPLNVGRRPIVDTQTTKRRRWMRLLPALAVLFAVSAPIAVYAAGGHFNDDEDSIFEEHINWMPTPKSHWAATHP